MPLDVRQAIVCIEENIVRLIVRSALPISIVFAAWVLIDLSIASAQFLRVVAYNIEAGNGIDSNLTTVLRGIGNEQLAGHAQPIDVLALEELAPSPTTTTLPFIVSELNNIYGAGTYAFDSTLDPTTGGTGGGPSGLVYNTKTVQLLGAKAIGTSSGSGAARAPMRYELAPIGYNDHSADFWLYVSHMKSGTGASNENRRNIEANTIRTNSALGEVGANAHVIYAGDYNVTGSAEAAYKTMVSSTIPNIGSVGQAIDTVNPTNDWTSTASFLGLLTESAVNLEFRDDFQFVTSPMLNQNGVRLVANTYTAFGNDGSTAYHGRVDAGTNTALPDLGMPPYDAAYRQSVLSALTTATDHLPIVADYSFASAVGIPGDYDHSGTVDNADYTLWQTSFGSTTNLAADGNGNQEVDAADYTVWRDNLGNHIPPGGGAGGSAAVPEPSTAALLFIGICLVGLRAGRLRE
jgi:PEP-CTERM motif